MRVQTSKNQRMPIELKRKSEQFAFSNHQWEETLLLAKESGWSPKDAPDENWERFYFASNGDVISARDSNALADSLEAALKKTSIIKQTQLREFISFCRRGDFRIE